MRKLSTRLHRRRKLTAKTAIIIAAALGIMLGIGAPAHASGTSAYLPTFTHTCEILGNDGAYQAIFCVDLALYTAQDGNYDVTLQVEGYCPKDGGGTAACSFILTQGTVASSSYTDLREFDCVGTCQSGRTYFYPYGGIPISLGKCDDNIWGILQDGGASEISVIDGVDTYSLAAQLKTGHFDVCLSAGGTLSATAV